MLSLDCVINAISKNGNFLFSAPGGDLQTLIDGDLVPLEGDVVHFVRQLVEGLVYLHERNIAHLDIKVSLTHKRSIQTVTRLVYQDPGIDFASLNWHAALHLVAIKKC